jgi:formylglycine-generating enzyme required for sulfatase activity
MREPSESEKTGGKSAGQGPPSETGTAGRALFQSSAGDEAPRPRARIAIGVALGGCVALLGGLYAYRAYKAAAIPPPPPAAPAEPPPPQEGPALPRDAVVHVPEGKFMMGSTDGDADEQPVTEVHVAAFDIDLTEVTVGAYRACVDAGKCTPPDTGLYCNWDKPGRDRHPVNCVDWQQALAYCAFVGKRLPTEQEWEFAGRGTDGRKFPWKYGQPESQVCWNGDGNDLGRSNRQGTCSVGRYPAGASPVGALDMAGNVWEWTADAYCSSYDGKGCSQDRKVIRGGGWNNVKANYVRAQDRSQELVKARNDNVGFRCARAPK